MSLRRESAVEQRLLELLQEHPGPDPTATGPMDGPLVQGADLTRREAVLLFEAGLQSRFQDLEARRLKDRGVGYHTVTSSGHEANALFGHLLRADDPAFLHYRSGAFMVAHSRKDDGATSIFDSMLAMVASAEDPVSGGRHKVLGSRSLHIPPQTSTIASHLPKAVGYAFALGRMQRCGEQAPVPFDAVIYCSFGDASANHATALAAFNAAAAAALQRQPCPILFVCEDNGFGISVRTPSDYIERVFRNRAGLEYAYADGRDLPGAYARVGEAIERCRRSRAPLFFHLRTARLMGHAGTDLEANYLKPKEIEANEKRDPLLSWADLLLRSGTVSREQILALYRDLDQRVRRSGAEACNRRHLESAAEVKAPLALPDPARLQVKVAAETVRQKVFGGRLPESDTRPRHMAYRLAQALKDLMAAYPGMYVFGEDVAKKGGVYHVTDGLYHTFGGGRVFNTILDETTILGLAQGMAQAGCLPFPEIQYLAYIHNALDQIRGEAASIKFFSRGQFANPMVVRIASFAYQKGFGGHFHNDNSVGALLDIPGLIIAVPARADDAVGMLRTCAAAAAQHGAVCLFLEPIALYMTKDLFEPGDGLWQFPYPPPNQSIRLGEPRIYNAHPDDDLTIVSYANGLRMSLQAQQRLARDGVRARVLDLRWLAPLPVKAVAEHALATGSCLLVDECRYTMGGPSPMLLTEMCQDPALSGVALKRLAAADTFVPLGPAADTVLVQPDDIYEAAVALCAERAR
jgi:2-oxoisovalerate dehydrogenase E1 component